MAALPSSIAGEVTTPMWERLWQPGRLFGTPSRSGPCKNGPANPIQVLKRRWNGVLGSRVQPFFGLLPAVGYQFRRTRPPPS